MSGLELITAFTVSALAAAPAQQADRGWTIAIFGAADSSCEETLMDDLAALKAGFTAGQGLEVVLLIDRSPKFSADATTLGGEFSDTRMFRLGAQGFERIDGGKDLPQITTESQYEADTGDPALLRGFLREVKARYPARRQALVIYSHGDGKSLCPDETDKGTLHPAEISAALSVQDSVDLIGLDVCSMGGLEVAYEWRSDQSSFGAHVLVASASVSDPWPYKQIFSKLRATSGAKPSGDMLDPRTGSAQDLGLLILGEIRRQREGQRRGGPDRELGESWACFDQLKASQAKTQLDRLASVLSATRGAKEQVEELRGSKAGEYAINYIFEEGEAGIRSMPYFDAYDLADRIRNDERFGPSVRSQAGAAAEAVDALVIDSFQTKAGAPFKNGVHGAYIVFPDGDRTQGTKRHWAEFGWYAPASPEAGSDAWGGLSWSRDGSKEGNGSVETWFELMDFWFDDPNAAVGGLNGYRP